MTKKIYSRNWDFTVYQVDDKMIINVVFFGLVDFHRSFRLLEEDLKEKDYESLKTLSERIRSSYDDYRHREIIPAIRF